MEISRSSPRVRAELFKQVRSFGTMTRDLRALADYLQALGVTHVAMEATGVLWKPVWNVLRGAVHVAVGQSAAKNLDGCVA
jgi:hypothetical protein